MLQFLLNPLEKLGMSLICPMLRLLIICSYFYDFTFRQFSAIVNFRIQQTVSYTHLLLLCDEPTGALDSLTGMMMMKQLKEMCKSYGHTTVIVTHNSALKDTADKVIYVKNGMIEDVVIQEHPCDINEVNW